MIPVRVQRGTEIGDILKELPNLNPDHPLVFEECPACAEPLSSIREICLVYIGTTKENREKAWFTGGAVAVHTGCIK